MLVKDKARQDAEDVLAGYWTAGFPVDPERIAISMGMRVDRTTFDSNVSGILRVEPFDIPRIYIDRNDVYTRQRFTIAHEIGHFFERTESGEDDFNFIDKRDPSASDYDIHEFYADEFAGNLLMPRAEVVRVASQNGASLPLLAAHFDVSLPAMRTRMKRLSIR